jgi:hypothetical protein
VKIGEPIRTGFTGFQEPTSEFENFKTFEKNEIKNSKKTRGDFKSFGQNRIQKNQSNAICKIR